MKATLKIPFFLALDVDTPQGALELAEKTAEWVGGFKLGPRLLIQDSRLIQKISKFRPVFVDNKYFDIPNTMEYAVRSTLDQGAQFVTVHAQCGVEACRRLSKLEEEYSKQQPTQILGITILTSFSAQNLPNIFSHQSLEDQVLNLAQEFLGNGMSGLVCSPFEAKMLRTQFPKSCLVTPGIRIDKIEGDDQSRVMTPKKALETGADYLVVGRLIYGAEDPIAAAKQVFDQVMN